MVLMPRPARTLVSAAVLAALTLTLSGCDRWSSTCDWDNTCEIMIQGDQFHDFPRPYDTDDGLRNTADRIRLVSAEEGGVAFIQAGGAEFTCAQGEVFKVVDTTITCNVVGDDRVEMTTTRP